MVSPVAPSPTGAAPGSPRLGARLARAAVIGFATIFASKPREEQHWSEPPTALIVREDEASTCGDPDRSSTPPR